MNLTNYSNEEELLEKIAQAGAIKLLASLGKMLKATNTGTMFKGIAGGYRSGGISEALGYAAKYRNPLSYLSQSLAKSKGVIPTQLYRANTKKFLDPGHSLRTFVGNIAHSGQTLTKGLSQKGVLAPFQFAKNLGTLAKQQLRGATLKRVNLAESGTRGKWFNTGVIDVGGQKYWKSWTPGSKRKIIATTGGQGVIKKRLLARPLAYAGTGAGFGAITLAAPSGEQSKAQRVASSLKETALWTATPGPAGAFFMGKFLKDTLKPKKQTNQIKNINTY